MQRDKRRDADPARRPCLTVMTALPSSASSPTTAVYTSWLKMGRLSLTSVRLMLTVAMSLSGGEPPSVASMVM